MAAAEGVGAAEGDDLAVVEAHAAEDGAEVGLLFGAVGEAAVGGAHADVAVGAAGSPGDYGACGPFVSGDRGEWLEGRGRDVPCISWIAATPARVQRSEYVIQGNFSLTGFRKSRAVFRPAFAPWSPSGANLMVAPLEPPVLVSLSYLRSSSAF